MTAEMCVLLTLVVATGHIKAGVGGHKLKYRGFHIDNWYRLSSRAFGV